MVDALMLKELLKLFRCDGRAVVGVNCVGRSILGN